MLDQQQALGQIAASAKTPDEYQKLRDKFFNDNPLTNPITNHPLRIDMASSQAKSGGPKLISVEPIK
jgi:hypothetical protein